MTNEMTILFEKLKSERRWLEFAMDGEQTLHALDNIRFLENQIERIENQTQVALTGGK